MSRNQHCRTMSLLIGMFLIITMMSKYHVAAYYFDEFESSEENNQQSLQRLRHLVRKLQRNDDEELFFEARADLVSDCKPDILEGYEHSGETLPGSVSNIPSPQNCMDRCDSNAKCVGWTYNVNSKWCWFFSSITGKTPRSDVKSGFCFGNTRKIKCTEKKNGQYIGYVEQGLNNIATVEDCMTNCDQTPTCLSWVYTTSEKICIFHNTFADFQPATNSYFITGSCVGPPIRINVADPIIFFQSDVLDRHNEKRKLHCTPELTLDRDLNQKAQDIANNLATIDMLPPDSSWTKMQAVYYQKPDYTLTGDTLVNCFYGENKYFTLTDPNLSRTHHFLKVIWKSSKMMGVGRAFASDKITMYVVTIYDSDGVDIAALYKDNVLPKCS